MDRRIFVGMLFLALYVCAGYAQMRVFPDGRVGFGRYLANNRGIYISEAPNLTNPQPFSIVRTTQDKIAFVRNVATSIPDFANINGGIIFAPNGRSVFIGYPYWFFPNLQNYSLAVQAPHLSHGIGVRVHEAWSRDGIQVILDVPLGNARPFAAYRDNTLIFHVDQNGYAYTRSGLLITSDRSLKRNIQPIKSALERVMQLQGFSFDYHFAWMEKESEQRFSADEHFAAAQERTPTLTREIFDQMEKEQSRQRLGIIAQDVERVFPELVRTQEDGLLAVFYPEMVAVLIEAIKEQQAQIETLQAEVRQLQGGSVIAPRAGTGEAAIINPAVAQSVLHQNAPNPFSSATQINYYLPANVTNAFLIFYDLQGRQLKQITLTQRGAGSEIISGAVFAPGIYLYALIVDGQEVDVKRMILTE